MATTNQLPVDANTLALFHLDGTAGTAAKTDNAQGTAARDLNETGSPASGTGQITPTTDGAYNLNGSSMYLTGNDDAAYDGTTNFSIEFWVNFDVTTDDKQPVAKFGATTATNQSWRAITVSSKLVFQIGDGSTVGDITPTSTFSTGQWYYYAFTFDGSQSAGSRGKVYINGNDATSSDTTPSTILAGSASFMVGNRTGLPAGGYFDGLIDEIRISNNTRTATEIYNYYNDITPGTGNAMFMGANF